MSSQPQSPAAPGPRRPAPAEPTSTLPLRWGEHRWRLVGGGAAIAAGVASVLFTSTYSLQFLAVGSLLQIAGWIVLPARGWRRLTALAPGLFVSWLMLAGPDFAVFATVLLAGWLLALERPLPAWAALALPVLAGMVSSRVFTEYGHNWAVFALSGASVLLGAWCARTIARRLAAKTGSLEA